MRFRTKGASTRFSVGKTKSTESAILCRLGDISGEKGKEEEDDNDDDNGGYTSFIYLYTIVVREERWAN